MSANDSSSYVNRCVQLQPTADGLLTIWLDSPGRKVNVLDRHMLEALECAVDHVKANRAVYHALVFRSRKDDCFFVGADVNAIAEIHDANEAMAVVKRGQDLMSAIAALPIPTVAAISGTCLGGGLELALACDFRVVADRSATKLGLPEIKLGLIPGWGGTQRLPLLVGLQVAAKMILQGKSLSASAALDSGLADLKVEPDSWGESLEHVAACLLNNNLAQLRPPRPFKVKDWFFDRFSLGRMLVFNTASRKIAPNVRHYPALRAALKAIKSAVATQGRAFEFERESFVRLLFSDTGRSLIGLFQQRDTARKTATWSSSKPDDEIEKVAVVGAGAMGAGIGALIARRGYEVVFKEMHEGAVEAGRARAFEVLRSQADHGRISVSEMQQALARMEFSSYWEDTADCDLAIEAVLEIESLKREVFQTLDRSLRPGQILASNTSSLNITRLSSATGRREKVAGLHFFNPVERMDLVEVVRTEATDSATLATLLDFVTRLGKTPVVTSDKPGFLVNRVLFPYLGEAVRMVSEGFEVGRIDKQMRQFGMPMGPLELLDQVGLDVASHVAASLESILPDSEPAAKVLAEMVERGWLGKKSKLGFYQYQSGKRSDANAHITQEARLPSLGLDYRRDGMTSLQRRLILPLLNEAVHCLDELVVSEAWMVDLGVVLGTGFAPMHGGPLRMIDRLGAVTVSHNLQTLASVHGIRFRPADGLVRAVRREEKFFANRVPSTEHSSVQRNTSAAID